MTDGPQEGEGSSVWERLRRRKLVQWGLAYGAGAWGLLQVWGFAADAFHWPDVAKQIAMLVLAVGFPITLVLAWYHGDRGHQRVTPAELTLLALLILLGGGIVWLYGQRGEPRLETEGTPTSAPTPAAADERPSLAVLPFENRSRLEDDVFFVDGIHDDILTQLTKIGAMKVIARTSVEQFRGTSLPTREIGERLGVTTIVEGSVQRAGDRVRVTVQLIDVATDAHLWAESYDRELTAANIFAIQSDVAAAISDALESTLTSAEATRVNAVPTRNLEAWEAYQLGRQRMANRASTSLLEAETYFRRAIELDPGFAVAYSGLADTLLMQVAWVGTPPTPIVAQAERLAGKALELDPRSAEAWISAAYVAHRAGQLDRAEAACRRAVELNPSDATAHRVLSLVLLKLGRSPEGLEAAARALDLDPLSTTTIIAHARALISSGRFHEAEVRLRDAVEIDPSRPSTYMELAVLNAYARNRFVDAVAFGRQLVELDPAAPYTWIYLAELYLDLGDTTEALRLMEAARTISPDSAQVGSALAYLFLHLGREADAVRYARQAMAADPGQVQPMLVLTCIDLTRGDFSSARERYGQLRPELLASQPPAIDTERYGLVLALVAILQKTGETERASLLLDRAQAFIADRPRLSQWGYGLADAQIYALRGEKLQALAALREAVQAGWRSDWHYHRDLDPALASIRQEPEFKAVFAEVERDMARQRAELAARPKDAPLPLGDAGA